VELEAKNARRSNNLNPYYIRTYAKPVSIGCLSDLVACRRHFGNAPIQCGLAADRSEIIHFSCLCRSPCQNAGISSHWYPNM